MKIGVQPVIGGIFAIQGDSEDIWSVPPFVIFPSPIFQAVEVVPIFRNRQFRGYCL
jgi:hypothetical protein